MSNILKCNSCKIVIDEMLSYIQNKISISDEETLIRICVSSFNSDEILQSKSLLFDSLPIDQCNKITRKGKGKNQRDLEDIIGVFKAIDPDIIPIFVARQLEKLPPITFDHLDCTKLLKDIATLRGEMDQVKRTYVSFNQLMDFKAEMDKTRPSSQSVQKMQVGHEDSVSSGDCLEQTLFESIFVGNGEETIVHSSPTKSRKADEVNLITPSKAEGSSQCLRGDIEAVTHNSPLLTQRSAASSANTSRHTLSEQMIDNLSNVVLNAGSGSRMEKSVMNTQPITGHENDWKTVTYRKRKINYRFTGQRGVARDIRRF